MEATKPGDYYTADHTEAQQAIQRLRAGDSTSVETVIGFLERDPYACGTGYLKEAAWRCLRRVRLDDSQRARLRGVALAYVRTRMGREFAAMCRCVAPTADASLRRSIAEHATSDDPAVRRRADMLAAYIEGLERGEAHRQRVAHDWRDLRRHGVPPGVKKAGKSRWTAADRDARRSGG